MGQIQSIITLHRSGHSKRRIAELLGIHRESVAWYVESSWPTRRPNPIPGSDRARPVRVKPFHDLIVDKLERGLTGQQIYQDLQEEGFTASYSCVRRYLTGLRQTQTHPLPVRTVWARTRISLRTDSANLVF